MNLSKLALSLLAGIGTGCATAPSAPPVSMSGLPNCFDSNYDRERGLFTIRNAAGDPANQQCLLTVSSRGDAGSLRPGRYTAFVAHGGGGGAGGTLQAFVGDGDGGGGGGGAGAAETRATVNLTEGVYKLTIGAGGPGGSACIRGTVPFGGGPGWAGSPSNIIRVATGELVAGTPDADRYARPTRAQNEAMAGAQRDGRGGSGPGQASGGDAGYTKSTGEKMEAEAGDRAAPGRSAAGGAAGAVPLDDPRAGAGGGGGATRIGGGGAGGGESSGDREIAALRGKLGSGGGGGGGSSSECEPGAQGGHGFIVLRPN